MTVGLGIRHRKQYTATQTKREKHAILDAKNHLVCRARLKRSATTSAILCAFGLSSMTELQVDVPTQCPPWIFTCFAVCTTTLVAIHIIALVISNFILPNIAYLPRHDFIEFKTDIGQQNDDNEYARNYIELAWTLSTVFGMFLFLIQIVLLCWVKFYDFYLSACWAGTIVIAPFLVTFLGFCIYFHRELLRHSYELRVQDLKDIEDLKDELELDVVLVGIEVI